MLIGSFLINGGFALTEATARGTAIGYPQAAGHMVDLIKPQRNAANADWLWGSFYTGTLDFACSSSFRHQYKLIFHPQV